MEKPAVELEAPSIHLNGTSKAALSEGYEKAVEALTKALDALGETAPNARDYYPKGPGAYHRAVGEHAARVSRLRAVQGELYWLHESLDEGENAGSSGSGMKG